MDHRLCVELYDSYPKEILVKFWLKIHLNTWGDSISNEVHQSLIHKMWSLLTIFIWADRRCYSALIETYSWTFFDNFNSLSKIPSLRETWHSRWPVILHDIVDDWWVDHQKQNPISPFSSLKTVITWEWYHNLAPI